MPQCATGTLNTMATPKRAIASPLTLNVPHYQAVHLELEWSTSQNVYVNQWQLQGETWPVFPFIESGYFPFFK